jgi:hypothetical protein
VIDNQFDRHEGIDPAGVTAKLSYRIPHGSQIDDSGDPGEILHENPGRMIRDVDGLGISPLPRGYTDKILFPYRAAVKLPKNVLDKDFDRKREPGDVCYSLFLEQVDIWYGIFPVL